MSSDALSSSISWLVRRSKGGLRASNPCITGIRFNARAPPRQGRDNIPTESRRRQLMPVGTASARTSQRTRSTVDRQWQRNLDGLSRLARCRSVQDFLAVHSGLVRESLLHMAEDGCTIAEISLRAVNDASKAIAETAQEGGRSSALAA